jgi:hypothetical protein
VGSGALHGMDVRSLLTHRVHWWHQGPQRTTDHSMLCQLRLHPSGIPSF